MLISGTVGGVPRLRQPLARLLVLITSGHVVNPAVGDCHNVTVNSVSADLSVPEDSVSSNPATPDAVTAPEPAQAQPEETAAQPEMPEIEYEVDERLAGAVELARAAADAEAGEPVGAHAGVRAEAELIATHSFASELTGYIGWFWAVTVVRAPDSDVVTIDEVVLLPGATALRAPDWVPWNERLRPGDLSPGDLVGTPADDPRLVPGYLESDDPAVEEVSFELGLGRVRVLSREGRMDAADRWHNGDAGPDTPMAKQAPAPCGTCGFYLPLAGSLRAGFGACGNEISAVDGRIVSVEYGCGAHSEALLEIPPLSEPLLGAIFDDGDEILD